MYGQAIEHNDRTIHVPGIRVELSQRCRHGHGHGNTQTDSHDHQTFSPIDLQGNYQ